MMFSGQVEVEWLDNSELNSYSAPYFSWVSLSNRQASNFNTCRDRHNINLQVGLWGRRDYSSYRTRNMPPICYDHLRMLITGVYENSQKEFKSTGIPKLLELLHSAECQIGMKQRTQIYEVTNLNSGHRANGGAYMLKADSLWIRATPMISLYGLLIRLSSAHVLGDHIMLTLKKCRDDGIVAGLHDKHYLAEAYDGIQRVFKYGEKIWYDKPQLNQPEGAGNSAIEEMGIKGFTKKYTKILPAKHWYRDIDLEEKQENEETLQSGEETARVVIAHQEGGEAAA